MAKCKGGRTPKRWDRTNVSSEALKSAGRAEMEVRQMVKKGARKKQNLSRCFKGYIYNTTDRHSLGLVRNECM